MKLRRLLCFLLALSLFICGAYSAFPCGHVAAADAVNYELVTLDTPNGPVTVLSTDYYNSSNKGYILSCNDASLIDACTTFNNSNLPFIFSSDGLTLIELNSSGTRYYFTSGSNKYLAPQTFVNTYNYYLLVNFDTGYVSLMQKSPANSLYSCTSNPYFTDALLELVSSVPSCDYIDFDCNNICDDCGEVLPMEYWSTELEYMVTTGYGLISKNIFDNNPHFFCVIYNSEDQAPELITSRTAFTVNSYRDVLFCENPSLYKLSVNDDGTFSHFLDTDVSSTSEGIYIDPNKHDPMRFLYSNVIIQLPLEEEIAYAYAIEYDPFGGGETVGGGADRAQIERFDIDIDTYKPVGGLPSDPEYGSGRVDVVVSPSAPPLSVPVSPTATPVPSDPVVTPSPDPSEPNSIIIQNQITNIGENIAALPEKLGDKIAGAIKGLFVPSEDDFLAIRFKWNMLLEERFGAVYESTAIIDSIVDTFQYSGDMSSIKFPAVTVDLAGTPFTFGGWDVEVIPEGFKFLVSSVKLIVSIVCTVLFVNAMRKKLEGLLNR